MLREPVALCTTMNITAEYIQNVLKLGEAQRIICKSYNLKRKGNQDWKTSFVMFECYNSACALLYWIHDNSTVLQSSSLSKF